MKLTTETPSEIRPAVDLEDLKKQAWKINIEIADGERLVQATSERLDQRRLKLGRLLIEARRAFPRSGPKAAGWERFCVDIGITRDTALNYMKLAGHVEESHGNSQISVEPSRVPTYAEAGIKKPPKAEPPEEEVTEAERNASYQREVEASLPPRMEVREKRAREVVEIAAAARASMLRFSERNVHLTDVTTSPDDFMRAKQSLIDIVNYGLDELARAGVLDGKEQRRQMQLLKGGRT